MSIGEKISPILEEIEATLWEFEAYKGCKPEYPIEAMKSSIKIFMSVMLDKMWELQEKENIDSDTRANMAKRLGEDLRFLVRTYTDIDTHELYQ